MHGFILMLGYTYIDPNILNRIRKDKEKRKEESTTKYIYRQGDQLRIPNW